MYFFIEIKIMSKKNQSNRLTAQQKASKGVVGIFGEEAKLHYMTVGEISRLVVKTASGGVTTIGIPI